MKERKLIDRWLAGVINPLHMEIERVVMLLVLDLGVMVGWAYLLSAALFAR